MVDIRRAVTGIPGRAQSTIMDVARLSGVSKGAVSLAFGGKAGVADATRARILEAARQLNWQPSIHARALLRSRAFALGLVISRKAELLAADPFYGRFIAGVEDVLAESGYVLVLQVIGTDVDVEAASYRRLAGERRVDGVFLIDLRVGDPRITWLAELGVPAVSVGPPIASSPFPCLDLREEVGVEQAVHHLADLGHAEIAYVGGTPGFLAAATRAEAWRNAMRSLGLAPRLSVSGDFTGAGGAVATRRLLARTGPPTAIVYANDLMAIAGMTVARDAGCSLPEDLSVVGFDDSPLAAYITPGLTTLRQDPVASGRAAATVLLALIDGEDLGRVVHDPPVLVRRASTGPPRL